MARWFRILVPGFLILSTRSLVAQDRDLGWRLQPIFSVGGASDSILVLTTLHPNQVVAGSDNRIVLLDRSENQIVFLSPQGRVEQRFSRRGAGPGELGNPRNLAARSDGSIWVWDAQRNALVGFGRNGTPLSQRNDLPGTGLVQAVQFLSSGEAVVFRTRRDSLNLWQSTSSTPVLLAGIVQPPTRSVPPGNCEITDFLALPVFTPGLAWAVRGRSVAVNSDGTFAIHIRGGSHDGVTLTRTASLRRATSALAKQELGRGFRVQVAGRGEPCRIPADGILSVTGFAAHVPAYNQLLFTSDDTLWAVRRTLPGEARVADVYSLARGYLGTISLGGAVPIAIRTDGSIVSLETDKDEVPQLVVYRILH